MNRLTLEKLCEILQKTDHVTFVLTGVGEETHSSEAVHEVVQELLQYKALEEQGRLIILPVKPFSKIYYVHWAGHKVSYVRPKTINECLVFIGKIGTEYFLTKEEAEAKLAELKGE